MQVRPGMKPNRKRATRIPVKAENVLKGEEQRLVTWPFYICNFSNFLICLFAFTPLSKINTFLVFALPHLYFSIRLFLYKLWYRMGYHPLPERRYQRGPKGGIHLPVFTKNTEEYKQIRQQQSLKYQIMYNTYKIIYRTCYFSFLFVFLSVLVYMGEEGFPVSSQENTLYQLSGGIEEIVPFLMGVLALLTFLLVGLLYEAGKVLWQSHFYQRYPVKVLLFERDEPILSVKNREEFAIF